MVAIKVEFSKHATSTNAEPTGLGRQNHIDVFSGEKKL